VIVGRMVVYFPVRESDVARTFGDELVLGQSGTPFSDERKEWWHQREYVGDIMCL
jgi:hypothetical protein